MAYKTSKLKPEELAQRVKAISLTRGDTQLIIAEAKAEGFLRNELAYVLATTYLETGYTMKPVTEMGSEAYLKAKKYWPEIGRGYVQITWERNYRAAAKMLGLPERTFIDNHKLLLLPKYAVPILLKGMKTGLFTGKKLSDYITLKTSGYFNARRIVNGLDAASDIAAFAKEYERQLTAVGYGVEPMKTKTLAEVVQAQPATTAPAPSVEGTLAKLIRVILKLLGK